MKRFNEQLTHLESARVKLGNAADEYAYIESAIDQARKSHNKSNPAQQSKAGQKV